MVVVFVVWFVNEVVVWVCIFGVVVVLCIGCGYVEKNVE